MRRYVLALFVTVMTVMSAGPANAASGVATRFTFRGTFAEAEWFMSSATSFTDTYLNVSQTKQGAELFVDQFTATFNRSGRFLGGTEIFADVTSGFSFTIDAHSLSTASASGSALPATTCSIDAQFNETCSDSTIDVSASWTGQGSIGRGTFAEHFQFDGFKVTDHFQGTFRNATATGTIGGLALTAADLEFADMGTTNYGEVDICMGC